ncbi:MAG: lysine exporter LysO family protein, partial [Enterobacteriaceae bacterium]
NQLLSWLIFFILFLMGISLGLLNDLDAHLLQLFKYIAVTSIATLSCCGAALLLLERYYPWRHNTHQEEAPSRPRIFLASFYLCAVVFLGFLLGLTRWSWLHHASAGSHIALMVLLFLVGIQLGNSGMTLRQIVLNRRGMIIALTVAFSSLIGGVIAALILGLPLNVGLALASGYGWYTLSGIVLTQVFGPVIGSTAFFTDLIRELVALVMIPVLIQRHRTLTLGICGSTSLDFTLPLLQRSGGIEIVPAAIVHGFILSLLTPILMGLFSY